MGTGRSYTLYNLSLLEREGGEGVDNLRRISTFCNHQIKSNSVNCFVVVIDCMPCILNKTGKMGEKRKDLLIKRKKKDGACLTARLKIWSNNLL